MEKNDMPGCACFCTTFVVVVVVVVPYYQAHRRNYRYLVPIWILTSRAAYDVQAVMIDLSWTLRGCSGDVDVDGVAGLRDFRRQHRLFD